MAETTYPKIGAAAWYTLRTKAMNTPSAAFTPTNIAVWLEVQPGSAKNNVLLPMTRFGIIDEKGSLTPLGKKWRSNDTYADACDEILAKNYPEDLASFTDAEGKPDFRQILTWFQHQGLGSSNASQCARTYELIAKKDPTPPAPAKPKATDGPSAPKKSSAKKAAGKPAKAAAPRKKTDTDSEEESYMPPPPPGDEERRPDLHIDIQVHIGADASPDQIDAVFASMARHIYKK